MFRGLSNDRRQMAWNSTSDCSRSRSLGLVRSQRRLCQNHLDVMTSVVRASRDTVDVCQEMFADRRWNCSTITLAPHFLPDLAGSEFCRLTFSLSFFGFPRVSYLVSWSLTSLFSTNMAISETKGQGWKVIRTQ